MCAEKNDFKAVPTLVIMLTNNSDKSGYIILYPINTMTHLCRKNTLKKREEYMIHKSNSRLFKDCFDFILNNIDDGSLEDLFGFVDFCKDKIELFKILDFVFTEISKQTVLKLSPLYDEAKWSLFRAKRIIRNNEYFGRSGIVLNTVRILLE